MKLIKNNPSTGSGQAFLPVVMLVLGFVGFLDAAYLTIIHYKDEIPPCTVTNGCETVLTSSFSEVFGIPIALFGAFFYISIMALSLLLITKTGPKKLISNLLVLDAVAGFVVSVVLIYIQFAILKTYCQYCILSEVVSFLIFAIAIALFKLRRNRS